MGYPGDHLSPPTPAAVPRHARPEPAKVEAAPPHRPHWVPVRSLAPRHAARILAHLLTLDTRDRYLRFGFAATDEQVMRYVEGLQFERDELFGIFNRRLELIAMAHLAHIAPHADQPPLGEFGVSVLPAHRGRGYGARLFEHALLHARNRGIDTMIVHALSENQAMLKIARNAGATVQRDGPESEARLKLPPEDLVSQVEEIAQDQAAEIDYRLKQHARRMDSVLSAIEEVRLGLSRVGHTAQE
jgi:GNAT superfamily N-acetyltransferase